MRHTNVRGEMPFLDHLEELRWRILKSLSALFLSVIVGFLLVHYLRVTELLVHPIRPFLTSQGGKLAAFSPLTPFFLELKLALIVGILLAFPILVYQVWAFLSPALERHERRVIIPAMYMGLVLFCAGAVLAYLILPISLDFLFRFQSDYLNLVIGANEYLSFVVRLLLAFGIIFELPVVVMILSALGLVTPQFLRAQRRVAIVAITVVASFLSPGDVIIVTVLMMAPLILLYEFSILLSAMITKGREERNRILDQESADAGSAPEGAVQTSPHQGAEDAVEASP